MVKRTLYFGNPCVLRKKDIQMIVEFHENEAKPPAIIPIEDIGLIVLDNQQIMISQALIMALNENNAAIISCDTSHLPYGLTLPMFSNHAFTEKLRTQIDASVPLMKNLWQQTIVAKINNQTVLLKKNNANIGRMEYYSRNVKSGDPENVEGRAAAYYWDTLFGAGNFKRQRYGVPPNNLLNYGYAVLRAVIARSLVASGLLTALGIHHRNKYNPYCLADDIMEPYRPFVDELVLGINDEMSDSEELTPQIKRKLLEIPVIDVEIEGKSSPLMVGVQRTTSSLTSCFEGTTRKLLYPNMVQN